MPLLLLVLLVALLAYLYWRRRTTTLTRDGRWAVGPVARAEALRILRGDQRRLR